MAAPDDLARRFGTVFVDLLAEERLRCPRCGAHRFAEAPDGVRCESCRTVFPEHNKVVDFYDRYDPPKPWAGRLPWDRRRREDVARQLIAHLGIPATDDAQRRVEALVRRTARRADNPAFSAEIGDLLDRFGIADAPPFATRLVKRARREVDSRRRRPNGDVVPVWDRHYVDGPLAAGATSWHNVRVRNAGSHPWSSKTGDPVNLSYRWLTPSGETLPIEGDRTPFPIDVDPGRGITVPLQVTAPQQAGDHVLQVQLVHENHRWIDEPVLRIPVTVAPSAPRHDWPIDEHPDRYLDYAADHVEGVDFLTRYMDDEHDGKVRRLLEIGGGTSPQAAAYADRQVVNLDISSPILELGALFYGTTYDERLCYVCADALDPPFEDGTFDGVVMFATMHHFPEPDALLRRCRALLAPGGFVGLLCEPVGHDLTADVTVRDLLKGINEQTFVPDEYVQIAAGAGLRLVRGQVDGGSLKAILRPADDA
jgi:hypothetical protein